MKSLFGLGMLIFALSFCNIGERLNELQSAAEATNPAGPESSTSTAERDSGVDHSGQTYVLDPQGRLRLLVRAERLGQDLAPDLKALLGA